jgi:DNA-directed RNA polymerase subunit RPC12/RpoP
MSEKEALHGLSCPNCGGMVPIPEGQEIVHCPYCNLRSYVKGERGLRRYQVPLRTRREDALNALRQFFKNVAIARDVGRRAQVTESFLVYLPYWVVWGRAAAWAFGEKKVGSGDSSHYEPREIRIVQEMTWSGAACDVGEFGVTEIPKTDQTMEPFDPDALHRAGMVFQPVGSFSDARAAAEKQFQDQVRQKADLDRVSQLFVRFFRQRFGLVYYPLWVLRYSYRGRAFQVVVDGYSGKTLYGKAPGNSLYRAAVLVGGMAVGAFLAIDVPAFILSQSSDSNSGPGLFVLLLFVGGLALMFTAYRRFRYGEQYEYRSAGSKPFMLPSIAGSGFPLDTLTSGMGQVGLGSIQVKDVERWISRLS